MEVLFGLFIWVLIGAIVTGTTLGWLGLLEGVDLEILCFLVLCWPVIVVIFLIYAIAAFVDRKR